VKLIKKYSNVPMGFADACLVRMTETLADPIGSLCDTRVILPPLIPAETEPGPTSARLVWRQKPEQQQWLEAREGDYLLRTNLTGNGAADLWKEIHAADGLNGPPFLLSLIAIFIKIRYLWMRSLNAAQAHKHLVAIL